MALPAVDQFTGADGTALQTYSSAWSINAGAFVLNTNAVTPQGAAADIGARWNNDTFANDQYAQGTFTAGASGPHIGPAVRCGAAGVLSHYSHESGSGNPDRYFGKRVAGTWTQFSQFAGAATGDVLRVEAQGTTIRALLNGAIVATQTDSALSSGVGGLAGFDTSTANRLDNWEAGNLAVLYLRNAASDVNPGAETEKLASATRGAASVDKATTTTASGTNIQATDGAGGAALAWFSGPLSAVTIAGQIAVRLRGRESAIAVNSGRGILIQRCDGAGAVISSIVADTAHGTEFTTTDAANAAWNLAPTSTALADGDRIKIVVKVRNVGTMGAGTVTYSIDGPTDGAAGDSWVRTTEGLVDYVAAGDCRPAPAAPVRADQTPQLAWVA